jgi:hypothetical protein
MRAAIKDSAGFDAMADDFAAAMIADRRQRVDGAFKAIEEM